MKLECSLCKSKIYRKTDQLWLHNINGRDYLLCQFHKGKQELKERYQHDHNKTKGQEVVQQ